MNSFAPKNIPLQQILCSWGTGIDSPLVAPKSLGFGFKTPNSQKLLCQKKTGTTLSLILGG